jgi:hypothetical protein
MTILRVVPYLRLIISSLCTNVPDYSGPPAADQTAKLLQFFLFTIT